MNNTAVNVRIEGLQTFEEGYALGKKDREDGLDGRKSALFSVIWNSATEAWRKGYTAGQESENP